MNAPAKAHSAGPVIVADGLGRDYEVGGGLVGEAKTVRAVASASFVGAFSIGEASG